MKVRSRKNSGSSPYKTISDEKTDCKGESILIDSGFYEILVVLLTG